MRLRDAYRFTTSPLGYLASVMPSGVDKKSHDGEIPVRLCNYTDIYYHDYITADMEFMEATATGAEIERYTLRIGDVLITKDSETADDIGIPALVTQNLGGVVLGYHNAMIRVDESRLDSRFLFWVLKGRPAAAYFETKARGVTRVGLRSDDIASLPVPVPPLVEQHRISELLDRENDRLNQLIGGVPSAGWGSASSLIAEFVRLVRSRRQALITAAVTGRLEL
jgi:type I restriction enzyme, S subunit